MSVVVSWKGNSFDVPFNEDVRSAARDGDRERDAWAKRATLGDLVQKCSVGSRVPKENIKLLHAGGNPFEEEITELGGSWWDSAMHSWDRWMGWDSERIRGSFALMKDMDAPLAKYGIRSGSKIMMIGDAGGPHQPPPPQPPKPSRAPAPRATRPTQHSNNPVPYPSPSTRTASPSQSARPVPQHDKEDTPPQDPEESLILIIDGHLAHVRETALPIVEDYVRQANAYLEAGAPTTTPVKALRDLHAKAAEVLLQRLLKLDGVVCAPGFDRARARRKEAVRIIQGELDRVDSLKERVRNASSL
ncbi:hypothetical protein HKX48_009313 [Thoreauomyces humboldtii]|nr:hypothetical protein HKX48_009313 [Thoreauomyces humboldtii]